MNCHHRPFLIESRVADDDGTRIKHAIIVCSSCDVTEAMPIRQHSVPPPEVLAKWFAHRGWKVNRSRKSDLCPAHNAARLEVQQSTPEQSNDTAETAMTEAPQMLRKPTRAERRNILDEITSVYEEDVGYRGASSDATVAAKLDVPRLWVETIREDFFGPATNESQKKLREDLTRLMEQGKSLEERAYAFAEEIETFRKEADALGATFRQSSRVG